MPRKQDHKNVEELSYYFPEKITCTKYSRKSFVNSWKYVPEFLIFIHGSDNDILLKKKKKKSLIHEGGNGPTLFVVDVEHEGLPGVGCPSHDLDQVQVVHPWRLGSVYKSSSFHKS